MMRQATSFFAAAMAVMLIIMELAEHADASTNTQPMPPTLLPSISSSTAASSSVEPSSTTSSSVKPSQTPTTQTQLCYDIPGWYDGYGKTYDCDWYGYYDKCESDGYMYPNFNYTAKDACCVCGGGLIKSGLVPPPSQSPSSGVSSGPSTRLSVAPSPAQSSSAPIQPTTEPSRAPQLRVVSSGPSTRLSVSPSAPAPIQPTTKPSGLSVSPSSAPSASASASAPIQPATEPSGPQQPTPDCLYGCSMDILAKYWVCRSTLACKGCNSDDVCPYLCTVCSDGKYGGLDCKCSPPPENDCFETELVGTETETWTMGEFWKAYRPFYTDFILQRGVFEPLPGDTTIIAGTLFSFSKGIFKLTAVFPPLYPEESRYAELVVFSPSKDVVASTVSNIVPDSWHCLFRIGSLPKGEEYTYQVRYTPQIDSLKTFTYEGIIPLPVQDPTFVALSCFGFESYECTRDKTKFVDAVKATSPDIILLQGDQSYYHHQLVYGFLELIYTIQDITRSTPTIVQMDDHDYGQGNIWGAGEEPGNSYSGAGFFKPACQINMLQQLMMGHNPDSATDATLDNGITIDYTTYEYGRFDFAVLETRKFKNKNGQSLLGSAQELWLQDWCDTDMDKVKVVLSQSPFANLLTHRTSSSQGGITTSGAGRDENGFPKGGRDRVMNILQGCSSLIISGDQHLSMAVSYDDYGGIYDCTSPAAVNTQYWRLNKNTLGKSHIDGHGNQYTLHAVWNVEDMITTQYDFPYKTKGGSDEVKQARADGFLVVKINGLDAVCQAHSYRTSHDTMWEVDIPLQKRFS